MLLERLLFCCLVEVNDLQTTYYLMMAGLKTLFLFVVALDDLIVWVPLVGPETNSDWLSPKGYLRVFGWCWCGFKIDKLVEWCEDLP